jgi:hypothetical protein
MRESSQGGHLIETPGTRGFSRRAFLARGGQGALGLAALSAGGGLGLGLAGAGTAAAATTPPKAPAAPPRGHFRTEPQIIPPHLELTDFGVDPATGLVMLTPSPLPTGRMLPTAEAVDKGLGMTGVMITNPNGSLVWFKEAAPFSTNLQVQTYQGKPVLIYWTGKIVSGIGYGTGYILNQAYEPIATVKAGNGLQADLHEFNITPQNTAIISAYGTRSADLSAMGGSVNGVAFEGIVQEIDIATGKVLFQWNSLDHVPISETYMKAQGSGPQDYFHLNSAAPWDSEHLIISARNTWTAYLVSRRTGAIVWRLGGKNSDFHIGAGANFEWQHHIRRVGPKQITIFDDAAYPPEEKQSRALVLNVDTTHKRVALARAFTHPAGLLTYYEGSVQILPNGNVFVGWGTEPYSSEFLPNGELLYDLRFPTNDQSYRAFRFPWTGTPSTPPKIVVAADQIGGYALHASWNGATAIAHWQVLSGNSTTSLEPIALLPKSGFETAITVHPTGSYVAAAALDVHGKRLGVSEPVKV